MRVAGEPATRDTPIGENSIIVFVNGRDRTEGTYEERERVEEPQPANPQVLLGTAKGDIVTTYGEVSDKLASTTFDPAGRLDSPKAVALTFDDGPNPTYTKQVLAILRRYRVPATFFVVGYLAERYPGIIKDALKAGHAIGSHSWNHPHDFASLTDGKQSKQIEDSVDELQRLSGDPYLFRPPEGSYDAGVVQLATRSSLRTVLWSVDTHDYEGDSTASEIARYVLSHLRPGAIVLMHDGGGDQSATVKALPDIIKGIRKRGYDLIAIPRNG
jgi:peptidoglycan/xylan/chitin deacetylase (PgdA/CDA1 family)